MLRLIEQFLTPTCLCLLLLLIAALPWKRTRWSKASLWTAIFVLLLGGNEWVVRWTAMPLESRIHAPSSIAQADAIVVLGGGVRAKESPRPTVEVNEAGDRLLYGFDLFRQKKAPLILCTGGPGELGTREVSEAEDMRTLLQCFGVPAEVILVETNSFNTLENARNSQPLIEARGIRRILLVTSAVHMPRALAVFRRQFPSLEIVPAPTDYMFTRRPKLQPIEALARMVPSGENLMRMEQTLHEYLGLVYYRVRGWM